MLSRAVRCCVIVHVLVGACGCGGGDSSSAIFGHFGAAHTPNNRQGPNKVPTWNCPTASWSCSQTGCR